LAVDEHEMENVIRIFNNDVITPKFRQEMNA